MELRNLEVYALAKEIGQDAWKIYKSLTLSEKKVFGDQFIRSVDSIAANIAEGFGRFHYADKNKFNYNARGSLLESSHWLGILLERGVMIKEMFEAFSQKLKSLSIKLNNYIKTTKNLIT